MTWAHKGGSSRPRSSASVMNTGTQYSPYNVFDFRGGLNTREAVTMIANNQSPDLLNVTFDIAGSISKRKGFQKYIASKPSSSPIDALAFYEQTPNATAGKNYVMASSGGYLWAYDLSGSTWVQVDSIGANPTFASYYDTFYAVDGNKFISYDGNVAQVVAGAPNGKFLRLINNRLFLSGDPMAPNRVYFSDLGTPSSWPTLNFIDVDSNDGDSIIGFEVFQSLIVIFKKHSIWTLNTSGSPSAWTLRCINPEYGCIAPNSIYHLGNELWFLSTHGVYGLHITRVQDYMNIAEKSLDIQPDIYNFVNPQNAQACTHKNRYWLSLPSMGVTYVYDMMLKSWTKYSITATSFWEQDGSLYSGSNNGYVYQQDTGADDDGVAINAYYKTKYFDMGMPERDKKLKRILVYAEQQVSNSSVGVAVGVDFNPLTTNFNISLIPGASATKWGSFSWGASAWGGKMGENVHKTALSKQAKYVQVTLSNSGLDEVFTVRGFTILYRPKALR